MSLYFHTQNRQKRNRITVDIFDIVGRNGSSASKQSRQGNLQRGGGASNDTSACLAVLESSVQTLRSI